MTTGATTPELAQREQQRERSKGEEEASQGGAEVDNSTPQATLAPPTPGQPFKFNLPRSLARADSSSPSANAVLLESCKMLMPYWPNDAFAQELALLNVGGFTGAEILNEINEEAAAVSAAEHSRGGGAGGADRSQRDGSFSCEGPHHHHHHAQHHADDDEHIAHHQQVTSIDRFGDTTGWMEPCSNNKKRKSRRSEMDEGAVGDGVAGGVGARGAGAGRWAGQTFASVAEEPSRQLHHHHHRPPHAESCGHSHLGEDHDDGRDDDDDDVERPDVSSSTFRASRLVDEIEASEHHHHRGYGGEDRPGEASPLPSMSLPLDALSASRGGGLRGTAPAPPPPCAHPPWSSEFRRRLRSDIKLRLSIKRARDGIWKRINKEKQEREKEVEAAADEELQQHKQREEGAGGSGSAGGAAAAGQTTATSTQPQPPPASSTKTRKASKAEKRAQATGGKKKLTLAEIKARAGVGGGGGGAAAATKGTKAKDNGKDAVKGPGSTEAGAKETLSPPREGQNTESKPPSVSSDGRTGQANDAADGTPRADYAAAGGTPGAPVDKSAHVASTTPPPSGPFSFTTPSRVTTLLARARTSVRELLDAPFDQVIAQLSLPKIIDERWPSIGPTLWKSKTPMLWPSADVPTAKYLPGTVAGRGGGGGGSRLAASSGMSVAQKLSWTVRDVDVAKPAAKSKVMEESSAQQSQPQPQPQPQPPSAKSPPPKMSRRKKANMNNIHHVSNAARWGSNSTVLPRGSGNEDGMQSPPPPTAAAAATHLPLSSSLMSPSFMPEEYICMFCEYELFYGEPPLFFRACKHRKERVREKRRNAKGKAKKAAAAAGTDQSRRGAAGEAASQQQQAPLPSPPPQACMCESCGGPGAG